MDPKANLEEQRQLAQKISGLSDALPETEGDTEEVLRDAIHQDMATYGLSLAELVHALDEWRRSGGFDPYEQREWAVRVDRREPGTFDDVVPSLLGPYTKAEADEKFEELQRADDGSLFSVEMHRLTREEV